MQPPKKEKGPAPRPPSIVSAPSTPEREKGPAPPPPIVQLIPATPPTPPAQSQPAPSPVTTDRPIEESTPTKTPKETPPKEAKTSPKIKKEENVKSPAPKPPILAPQIKEINETTKSLSNHTNIAVKSDKISETKDKHVADELAGDYSNKVTANGARISDVVKVGEVSTTVSLNEAKTETPSAGDANGEDVAGDVATDAERLPRNRRYSHADAQQSRDSGQRLVEQVCRDAEKAVIDRLIR